MVERLERGSFTYYLQCRHVVEGETWEFWRWGRDGGLLRYKANFDVIDFDGEWDILEGCFHVELPTEVSLGGQNLERTEIEAFAARIHLALCAMECRNVVAWKMPLSPLPESSRDEVLHEFEQWMKQRGWKVKVDQAEGKISIKRAGFPFFRPKQSESEILEKDAWVAKAWSALRDYESDRTLLFVSEGVRQAW